MLKKFFILIGVVYWFVLLIAVGYSIKDSFPDRGDSKTNSSSNEVIRKNEDSNKTPSPSYDKWKGLREWYIKNALDESIVNYFGGEDKIKNLVEFVDLGDGTAHIWLVTERYREITNTTIWENSHRMNRRNIRRDGDSFKIVTFFHDDDSQKIVK